MTAIKSINSNKVIMENFQIIKNTQENSITVQAKGLPLKEHDQLLLNFEADSHNAAMTVANKFLDFEPYVPFSETIVATRQLTLFDKQQQPLHGVNVIIYQHVKAAEGEWRCEYHINIEHKNKKGKVIKTENLGGRSIIGYDMVQAIQCVFLIIDSVLIDYNNSHEEKIYWLEYGNDVGFYKNAKTDGNGNRTY
jgi:hypothetical protein